MGQLKLGSESRCGNELARGCLPTNRWLPQEVELHRLSWVCARLAGSCCACCI